MLHIDKMQIICFFFQVSLMVRRNGDKKKKQLTKKKVV